MSNRLDPAQARHLVSLRLIQTLLQRLSTYDTSKQIVKEISLSKALTCMKILLYKQELLFCQGDGYFWPQSCTNNLYISHRSLYAPAYSFWAIGSMLISLFIELLPGLIPLTMLRHAGWTLEKTICMSMTYNYSTTMFRSIFAQNVQISGRKIEIFNFCLWFFQGEVEKL